MVSYWGIPSGAMKSLGKFPGKKGIGPAWRGYAGQYAALRGLVWADPCVWTGPMQGCIPLGRADSLVQGMSGWRVPWDKPWPI